ncbi:Hypothetical protein PHPALM_36481 [Phytophthora palmivora]|uniref:Uncharacterized protein n=1 Tax=Phytophthora palmivora TaxID=4796 RepID=A0A2P4WZU5_9STRA|nr:Hypothetical protein PHPALM_36481 [Phytophthora palmivora]
MELLVADIRRQLDGDWALLGPATASSFTLDWGADHKLRLPRMEDALFGVSVRFPDKEEEHGCVPNANVKEQVDHSDSEQEVSNDPGNAAVIIPLESVDSTFENLVQPADESAADQAVGPQDTSTAHEISSNTSTCDACVSAVEIRSNSLQAETSAESMNSALQQTDKDGKTQLASVQPELQEILTTHSRAEILLEIEWARQALRDRRKVCQLLYMCVM